MGGITGIIICFAILFIVVAIMGIILWKIPKNCPKCYRIMSEEKVEGINYFLCKECGYREPKKIQIKRVKSK